MFPGGRPPSIFSAKKLNYCVRNGNRCDLLAITTEETFRFINSDQALIFISAEPHKIMKTLRLLTFRFIIAALNLIFISTEPLKIMKILRLLTFRFINR